MYAERPVALMWEGEWKPISKIVDRKLLPQGWFFLTITDDGWIFELLYNENYDEWQIHCLGEESA